MSYSLPDASNIFGEGGDSLTDASARNQATKYGLLTAGLGAKARQRAAEYRRRAFEEQAEIDARQTWTNGLIGLGGDLLAGGIGAGLKSWSNNRPTMGEGTPTAPSIDVANPTAGERALMNAQYKLHGW